MHWTRQLSDSQSSRRYICRTACSRMQTLHLSLIHIFAAGMYCRVNVNRPIAKYSEKAVHRSIRSEPAWYPAVSYTHLDVYKRQQSNNLLRIKSIKQQITYTAGTTIINLTNAHLYTPFFSSSSNKCATTSFRIKPLS